MNSEIKINYLDINSNNAMPANKNICMVKKSNLHNNIPIVNLSSEQRNIVQITDQSISRKNVGGKGSALYRMQQAGMKVPEFTTVDVKSIENLENHSLDIASLKPFISDIASFNLAEVNIANIKQYIQNRYSNQPEQRNLYLQGLANFIASDAFYQQITNSQTAESIRENYHQLIASLAEDSAIIVRSSGIKEDNYGDAQAGKFESLVHGKQDIILTCLQVLASGFQPHVCPISTPQPMSLIIQRCIDCSFGGVAMSRTSLKDHRGKIEFVPGQPKGGVSGVAGITPHTYLVTEENNKFLAEFTEGNVTSQFILKQQDNNNFEEKPVALTENTNVNLTEEQLKQIYQYIKQGEDMLLCPVDFEFAVAKDGAVYALQLRPLTVLTGGVNFTCPPPENPITTGTLISEGFCAGELFYVQSEQDADLVPQGAIVVANHGETWMVDNNQFFKKVGGFIFQQGGANDHIAITMRQQEKPYLVTTDNFDELKHSNAIVSLTCGNFKEKPGAYVTAGSEFADKLATMQSTVKADYQPRSSEEPVRQTPVLYFNRPDIAFKNLHDLNYILLDYFSADSWLTRCFTEKGMLLLTMALHRIEIIKEAKQEIQQLFADFELFLQGYKQYLQLGIKPDKNSGNLQKNLIEAELIENKYKQIKTIINNNLANILQQFIYLDNQTIEKNNFNNLLKNSRDIIIDTQKLNIAKNIDQLQSIHDYIFFIHKKFINYLPEIIINSGMGVTVTCANINYILFIDTAEQEEIAKLCTKALRTLTHYIRGAQTIIMENAILVTIALGHHSCTIEMLDAAEAGKERTLRINLSDDFKNDIHNFQGKLKRFWFLVMSLNNINFANNAANMMISLNEVTGIITIEVAHIKTKKEMLDKFLQLIKVLKAISNLDIALSTTVLNLEHSKWDFSILKQKLCNPSSVENQQDFNILSLILGSKISKKGRFYDIYNAKNTYFFKQGNKLLHQAKQDIIENNIEIILDDIDIKDKEQLSYLLLINRIQPIINFAKNKYHNWFTNKNNVLKMIDYNEFLISYIDPKFYNDEEVLLKIVKNYGYELKNASKELKNNKEVVLAAVKNDAEALKHASETLKNDKDVFLVIIKKNPFALYTANDKLKNDKDVVLAAVKSDGRALEHASDELKNDKEVVLAAVTNNSYVLRYASYALKNDKEVVLAAVKSSGRALQHASDALKNDKEVILAAVKSYGGALEYASEVLKNDEDVVLTAVKSYSGALEYASEQFKNNKDIVLAAVKSDGRALEHASDELKNNKDIVLAAVKSDGRALEHASDELKNNKDIVLAAVKSDGRALNHASDELKNNKDIVLAAVKSDGRALNHASDELKNNKDIVLAAVKSYGKALEYASDELKNNKDIVLAAVNNDGEALQYASKELNNNKDIVFAAVKNNAKSLKHASDELKNNKDIVLFSVKNNGKTLKHASEQLKNNKDIVFAAVNNNSKALNHAGNKLKDEVDILLLAIENNHHLFKFASDYLKNNKQFILKAIKVNYMVYMLINDNFQKDTEILQEYNLYN